MQNGEGGDQSIFPLGAKKFFVHTENCLPLHPCMRRRGFYIRQSSYCTQKTWVRCGCCKSDEDGDDDHRGTKEKSGIERGRSTRESSSLAC